MVIFFIKTKGINMIFLEQTVNQVLREEGQTIISLDALNLTWQDMQDLFIGVFEPILSMKEERLSEPEGE